MKILARLCLAMACTSCGEQEIRAIEAWRPSAEGGSGTEPPEPSAGAGGTGGATGLAGAPGAAGSPSVNDRGRVQVRDATLLTDKGTRLRGVTVGRDGGSAGGPLAADLVAALSMQNGLNALHVYLENSGDVAGSNAVEGDELVEMTSTAGMYLILGLGGGESHGSFDIDHLRSFWTFYAPRYAHRSHVLYEILNIPDTACSVAYKDETLAMQRDIYGLIRGFAPSTHVAMLSLRAQPTAAALEANLEALDGSVDWSKASVAFHTPLCNGESTLTEFTQVTRERGIAVLASEMLYRSSFDSTAQMESEGVGWFNFEWLVRTRDMAAFREAHMAGGVTWCPDFGQWPEDSDTCSTP